MPFVEVLTSVLLTYAASEYLYGSKWLFIKACWGVVALQVKSKVKKYFVSMCQYFSSKKCA